MSVVTFEREDGTEVEVEFTLKGGHPGTAPSLSYPGDPPEPPELEIQGASIVETGVPTDLTPEEEAATEADIFSRLGDFEDDGDYPEPDWSRD